MKKRSQGTGIKWDKFGGNRLHQEAQKEYKNGVFIPYKGFCVKCNKDKPKLKSKKIDSSLIICEDCLMEARK